jgi:hypothetical protein
MQEYIYRGRKEFRVAEYVPNKMPGRIPKWA